MSTPKVAVTSPLGSRLKLSDVPAPQVVVAGVNFGGAPIAPKARISLFTPDDWEEFVYEWVQGLEPSYAQIKRFGGAGDKGADVAAFNLDRS